MSAFDPSQAFADQFEPAPDGDFVYRHGISGPPIPVTAVEREAFIASFERSRRWLMIGMVGSVVLLISVLVGLSEWRGRDMSESAEYLGLLPLLAVFILLWRRAWNAPGVALEGRAVVGPQLSRSEAQRAMLSRTSWPQLGGIALVLIGGTVRAARGHSGFLDWIWAALMAFGVISWLILAYRKWRLKGGR